MLPDLDILEDWTAIRKVCVCARCVYLFMRLFQKRGLRNTYEVADDPECVENSGGCCVSGRGHAGPPQREG